MSNSNVLSIMAKSKSGGTRSYIRGRVGADVYSIGKDGKGKKQQVVRSLAETVANPQTLAQMRGRMIMSTIMQAVAELRPIIDHSFDNVIGKQPNISEFIRRNYNLIKADVAANAAGGNSFGLNKYQEKGVKRGAYVISSGQATKPVALVVAESTGTVSISLPSDNITIGGLKSALGMTTEDYFTVVGITSSGSVKFERFRVNPSLADSTAITAENVGEVFATEGNALAAIALASNVITLADAAVSNCCAVIVSLKTANGYIHNDAQLGLATGIDWNADAALPTYPVGSQAFLNGGDIYGSSESQSGGGAAPEPVQNPVLTIATSGSGSAAVKVGGNAITSGASVEAGATVSIEVTEPADAVNHATASIGSTNVALTLDGGLMKGTFTMPANNATLSIFTGTPEGGDDY